MDPKASPTAKEIVINAWKTFKTRDAGLIAGLFTADAEWIAPANNATAIALSHTHHMIGADQIARFIASDMHALFFDIDISFRSMFADGNIVVVEARMRATLPGGRAYDNDYCFVFTVSGAHISQVREYMDTRKGWQMIFEFAWG